MRFYKMVLACGLVVGMAGCKSDGPGSAAKSKIVQTVEAAGSGDLDRQDEGSIQNWLSLHPDVVKSISPDCGAAVKVAKVEWQQSTEGRVCSATAKVLFFTPKDLVNGDYRPTKK